MKEKDKKVHHRIIRPAPKKGSITRAAARKAVQIVIKNRRNKG